MWVLLTFKYSLMYLPMCIPTYVCTYLCMHLPMYVPTYVCTYLCVYLPCMYIDGSRDWKYKSFLFKLLFTKLRPNFDAGFR